MRIKSVCLRGTTCIYGVVALALTAGPAAVAGIRLSNTIDPLATLSHTGNAIEVSGPLTCLVDRDVVLIQITVTQRSTGARAEGVVRVECEAVGVLEQWRTVLSRHGDERFVPGPAIAAAFGRTLNPVDSPDAHQWLVPVTLMAN